MTQPDGEAGNAANSGVGAGITANLFTQDQLNSAAAASKREAIGKFFKDLGFDTVPTADDLKGTLSKASEFDKLKDGEKGEVQRLTDQLAAANEKANKVPVLEAQLQRAQIAADAGLKSRYWKYVEGDSADDINASVKETLADIRGGGTGEGGEGNGEGEGEGGGQGTEGGEKRLTPNPQQGASGGGGGPKTATLAAGADAYKAKYGKKE